MLLPVLKLGSLWWLGTLGDGGQGQGFLTPKEELAGHCPGAEAPWGQQEALSPPRSLSCTQEDPRPGRPPEASWGAGGRWDGASLGLAHWLGLASVSCGL